MQTSSAYPVLHPSLFAGIGSCTGANNERKLVVFLIASNPYTPPFSVPASFCGLNTIPTGMNSTIRGRGMVTQIASPAISSAAHRGFYLPVFPGRTSLASQPNLCPATFPPLFLYPCHFGFSPAILLLSVVSLFHVTLPQISINDFSQNDPLPLELDSELDSESAILQPTEHVEMSQKLLSLLEFFLIHDSLLGPTL